MNLDKVYFWTPSSPTALLHTCTQIREEAIGIFFGENTFRTDLEIGGSASTVLPARLQAIGPSDMQLLRRVEARVVWSAEAFYEVFAATISSSRPVNEQIDGWTETALREFIAKVEQVEETTINPAVVEVMDDRPGGHSIAGAVEMRLRAALPVLTQSDGLSEPAVVMEKLHWRT